MPIIASFQEKIKEIGLIEKNLSLPLDRNIIAFFCEPHIKKIDKNPDLMVKNSSLYKLEPIITLSKKSYLKIIFFQEGGGPLDGCHVGPP